jgi:hypothetical protein
VTNRVITHLPTLQKGKTAPDFLIFLKTGFEIVNHGHLTQQQLHCSNEGLTSGM